MRFILDGMLGRKFPNYFSDIKVTFKENCLSFPCGNSSICQQHGKNTHECSCPPGQILKGIECYNADPCFNIPCGVDRGICERNEDSGHNCRCFERFRLVENTCLIDPCYNNPCGNGTCNIIASSSHSCDCYPGYEAVNDTCNRNYCYDNPCHPGNCTVKDKGFTCNCPSSYQLIDGKCLEKESIVMHAVVGLAGGLTGLFLILVFLYVKNCCRPPDPELPTPFDKRMLEELILQTSAESSLAPSSSEHTSEEPTVSFRDGRPLQPIRCSSKYPPDSNGVLTSTYLYNHCHEKCRLPCRIHQPRFQENWPRAEDIQHYPHSEEETFNWQTQVQYPRYISIDSQPSTSNHASVEYCTDRESSL